MVKAFAVICLVALAGCSGMSQRQYAAGPCSTSPAGYDCQIEQYSRAP